MSKFIDMTGKRYGNLVVLKRVDNTAKCNAAWECLCDCGKTKVVSGVSLRSGKVKSCGCLRKNNKPSLRHGMTGTRLYWAWSNIKSRCYIETNHAYKNYGGRGIKMYDLWKNSFESFAEWAINNGYSDSMTIERVDVNGDYCPNNCTWIPKNKQQNNRTTCLLYTYNGETKNLTEWCNQFNLPYMTVYTRIFRQKWEFERAISEPVHIEKRNRKD